MIPKIIHYCWFGKNPKSEEIRRCIESWKTLCPDFTLTEWTEENFNVEAYPFTKKMYKEKRFAFVSDYARLHILYNEGGFYLDTDMLLLQNLEPLTHVSCVLGEEEVGVISAGMIGAEKHNAFIKACKDYYDAGIDTPVTIPRILTKIFTEGAYEKTCTVLPHKAFYPFTAETISEYRGQNLGKETYGVHLWNYSWGHPLNRFFKRIGIYAFGKKIVEKLGIKAFLKRILGFI